MFSPPAPAILPSPNVTPTSSVGTADFNQQRTATKTCRTVLQSGLPLPGYRNAAVDQQQQLDAVVQLQLDIVKPYVSERTIVGDTSVRSLRLITALPTALQRTRFAHRAITKLAHYFHLAADCHG